MKYTTQQDRSAEIGKLKQGIWNYHTLIGQQHAILRAATEKIQSSLHGELSPEEMIEALDKWSAENNNEKAWDDILRPLREKTEESIPTGNFDFQSMVDWVFNGGDIPTPPEGSTVSQDGDTVIIKNGGTTTYFSHSSHTKNIAADGTVTESFETTSDLPPEKIAERIEAFRKENRFPKDGEGKRLGLKAKTLRQTGGKVLIQSAEDAGKDAALMNKVGQSIDKAEQAYLDRVAIEEANEAKSKLIKHIGLHAVEIAGGFTLFKVSERMKSETRKDKVLKQVVRFSGVGLMIHGAWEIFKPQ